MYPGPWVKEKCYHPSVDLNKRYDNPSLTSYGQKLSAQHEGGASDVSLTFT